MPTPIGHSLGGLLLLKTGSSKRPGWRAVLFCLFFANAPDLDFIAGFLFNSPNRFHHGISHSIGAGVATGICVAMLMFIRKRKSAVYLGVLVVILYSSHLLMDFFSLDTSRPYGIPFFWPLTDHYFISPLSLFTDVYRGGSNSGFFPGLFSIHNGYAVFREIVVVLLSYLAVKKIGRYFELQKMLDWFRYDQR